MEALYKYVFCVIFETFRNGSCNLQRTKYLWTFSNQFRTTTQRKTIGNFSFRITTARISTIWPNLDLVTFYYSKEYDKWYCLVSVSWFGYSWGPT